MATTFYPLGGANQVLWQVGANTLKTLINTASAGVGDATALLSNVNYVILNPEWAIRFTVDGSTPTAAIWLMWATWAFYYLEGNDILNKIKIINAVKVNIAVGSIT